MPDTETVPLNLEDLISFVQTLQEENVPLDTPVTISVSLTGSDEYLYENLQIDAQWIFFTPDEINLGDVQL